MKRQIKLTIAVLICLTINASMAQQDPSYTLYQYNMNVINPAYAGTNDMTEVNLNYRSQWVNLDGSPSTQSLSFGTPVTPKVGLGLSIVHDEVYVLKETDVYADFSYKVKLSDSTDLFMGFKAGGSFINIDLNTLGITNDPVFMENVSNFNPNIGIGFYLRSKRFYATISAPHLLKSKRYEKDGIRVTEATDELHTYFGTGYTFELSPTLVLTPSLMGRFVKGAPGSVDLTATAGFKKLLDLGLSYRIDESLSALGIYKISEAVHFGYAYEMTTTEVKDYSDGSHEFLLRFRF